MGIDQPVEHAGPALVTGASSGIGRELARALAERGHGLVITARDAHALGALAVELEKEHGCFAEVLVADLTTPGGLQRVERRLEDRDVEVLVSCAGSGLYGPLAAQDPTTIAVLLQLDVVALTVLARRAVQPMIERGHGAILNVSSLAAFAPGPFAAAYHAAKAYVNSFSEALHEEVRGHGVHVTALCPGPTPTQFQARAGARADLPAWWWTDAEAVARRAISALERNRALCIPGALNRLAAFGARITPRGITRRSSGAVVHRMVQEPAC